MAYCRRMILIIVAAVYVVDSACLSYADMAVLDGAETGGPCKGEDPSSANASYYGTSVVICPGVEAIPEYAFQACSALTDVELPDSVITIGNYAFEEAGLVNFTIPNNVTFIGWFAFYNAKDLSRVTLSSSLTTIGLWGFKGTALVELTIPASVTEIGAQALDVDTLTTVYMPGHDEDAVAEFTGAFGASDPTIVAATRTATSSWSSSTSVSSTSVSSTGSSSTSVSSTSVSSTATRTSSRHTTTETTSAPATSTQSSVSTLSATSTSSTSVTSVPSALAQARAWTRLVSPASTGAQELDVESQEGFSEGDTIVIAGAGHSEVSTISAFGSFILDAPLENSYPVGSLVTVSTPADTPESETSSSAVIIVAVVSCAFCCMVGIAGWLMSRYFRNDKFRARSSDGPALDPPDLVQLQVGDCSGGLAHEETVDDTSDGLTLAQVETDKQLKSNTRAWWKNAGSGKFATVVSEGPERNLGIPAQDGVGMYFWFISRRSFLGLSDDQRLPRHQTLRDAGMLERLYITDQDVISGKARRGKAVVSHRWSRDNHIDPDCVKLKKLKQVLRSDPSIEYLWLDWISIPQKFLDNGMEGWHTDEDKAELDLTLKNVLSYLYLGCTVLLLWDPGCSHRFWTSAEAWTSMRAVSEEGVVPACSERLRLQVFVISGDTGIGNDAAREHVADLWLHRSAQEAAAALGGGEYAASVAGDKAVGIEAILRLGGRVQESVRTQSASQGIVTSL